MNISPCLSPIMIRQRDGSFHRVPCGKCDSCINLKGFSRVQRLEVELRDWPFQYFFTLTYDNNSVPRFEPYGPLLVHNLDLSTKIGSNVFVRFSEVADTYVYSYLEEFGFVPALSHRDLSAFVSFLKSYFYGKNTPFFYFICGEYGSTTFRPHYHGLIGLRSAVPDSFASVLADNWSTRLRGEQRQSYKLGFIDFQSCGRSSRKYVAQYLNSVSHLPALCRVGVRPFSVSSQCYGFGNISRSSLQQVIERPTSKLYSISFKDWSTSACSVFPRHLKDRYFPRPAFFGSIPNYVLVSLLSIVFASDSAEHFRWQIGIYVSLRPAFMYISDYFREFDKNFDDRLTRFYYLGRKIMRLCVFHRFTISQYLDYIGLFYSSLELHKLSLFYQFQQQLAVDPYFDIRFLNCLYEHSSSAAAYPCDNVDYYRQASNCPQYNSFASLMRKIILDSSKTKKRNSALASRLKARGLDYSLIS